MRSTRFLGAILILLGCHQVLADDDFTKEIVKSTPLTQSLYMLEGVGAGVNWDHFRRCSGPMGDQP